MHISFITPENVAHLGSSSTFFLHIFSMVLQHTFWRTCFARINALFELLSHCHESDGAILCKLGKNDVIIATKLANPFIINDCVQLSPYFLLDISWYRSIIRQSTINIRIIKICFSIEHTNPKHLRAQEAAVTESMLWFCRYCASFSPLCIRLATFLSAIAAQHAQFDPGKHTDAVLDVLLVPATCKHHYSGK